MKSLAELKREARVSATNRGHFLTQFSKVSARMHVAICKRCQRRVQLITSPLPNEIEIGGEAVAVNCNQ